MAKKQGNTFVILLKIVPWDHLWSPKRPNRALAYLIIQKTLQCCSLSKAKIVTLNTLENKQPTHQGKDC